MKTIDSQGYSREKGNGSMVWMSDHVRAEAKHDCPKQRDPLFFEQPQKVNVCGESEEKVISK